MAKEKKKGKAKEAMPDNSDTISTITASTNRGRPKIIGRTPEEQTRLNNLCKKKHEEKRKADR